MENVPTYRACKNQLRNILKNKFYGKFFNDKYQNLSQKDVLAIIEDAVVRTNIIVFHTYNFLNLYFLHLYESKEDFPFIDVNLVRTIMNIVSIRTDMRGRPPSDETKKIIEKLLIFFNKYYLPLLQENDLVTNNKLSYILDKEAEDMVKNINNNIKEHFTDHVKKYINDLVCHKEMIQHIESNKNINYRTRKKIISEIRKEWNSIKHDVLATKDFINTDIEKLLLIKIIKDDLLPYQNFLHDSIYYDLEVNPQNYLRSMITINRKIDQLSTNQQKNYKLFHVFPLRTSIEPKYITLNTNSIISLFSGRAEYQKYTSFYEEEIWRSLFNMEIKCFKWNGYEFANTIETDGIGCSIIFQELTNQQKRKVVIVPILDNNKINNELFDWYIYSNDGKKMKKNRKYLTKEERANMQYSNKDKDLDIYQYVEEIKMDLLHNRTMVFIDPGHSDLAECGMKECDNKCIDNIEYQNDQVVGKIEEPKDIFFRYTRAQRNRESKKFRYQKIVKRIKNKTIIKMETKLSKHNSKRCQFLKFLEYLKEKIKLNRNLYQHYSQPIYRKLKFNKYINYRKSEEKFIKNFQRIFGNPNKVVIIFGDYNKKNTMKGSEPHIAKRLKRLFRLHGYTVYLIDEYNTSKLCNKCGCELERFKWVKNKHGKDSLLWRLLRCTSEKCLIYHQRDRNAIRNMMKILDSLIKGKGRPKEYCKNE